MFFLLSYILYTNMMFYMVLETYKKKFLKDV